ncbi:hypothetical protein I317_06708 [Kwoniella heveanensis CBS 569]|uniref:2-hydroxyacid dehydrogenase n=1 Tax=Kwoniella heveanensis BCC8398 TaxID=1296120 RepID=A0A1B9GLW6_9TREE|nr:hypothetical protein I316_06392 [Kwoniella heveanensis BCC8398]OCF39490.1 hypothetical protein I317_06708 [Kwoniella heveanensis CBS 569]
MPYVKDIFYNKVGAFADIVELSSNSYEELEKDFKTKYLGVKAIYHLRDPGSFFGHLGEEFFRRVPSSCTVCSHLGAGYDDIDVAAARKHGVTVTHTPSAVDDATATTAIYLIISAMRQFSKAESACRNGLWKKNLPLARDPEYKTLGIVGMGGIGTVVARRMALGWGTKIIYHNRSKLKHEPTDFAVEYKESLDDLLKEADIVSLHIPMSAKTKNMLGKAQFDVMKKGSVLVNTARGGLVDEAALLEAIRSGKLHGVGLDVYPEEPKITAELFDHPMVTLLPHMGTETWDSRDKMALMVLDNILACLKDEPLPNIVPEHQKR